MPYRWVFDTESGPEPADRMEQELGVTPEIARLLTQRGIDNFGRAKSFFRPELSHLHDPFLMRDMEAAASRLAAAVRGGEKIMIYGDYDVDGTTATACMLLFLQEFGVDASFYIPHRYREGYGISPEGVQEAKARGASLVVSVDCGIGAVEEAAQLAEAGIDLVICDHHTVGGPLPKAVAVLDPKRPDCSYPFDGLSGAGVAFKLIQGTLVKLGLPEHHAWTWLDLVAISTASDIVPVVDENRVMMREGLNRIRSEPRPGIRALLDQIGMPPEQVNGTSILFSVGPRINAAGRMGDASMAVELLIAKQAAEAKRVAGLLESINLKRRTTDRQTLDEATAMVERECDLEAMHAMVLHSPGWHLGVIGIVASRLVDAYYRPVVMLSTVDGVVKGSARSIGGFNIYDALCECEDLLLQYGGHEFAAGLTLEKSNLEPFRERLGRIAGEQLADRDFLPELKIDARIELSDVNRRFWKLLSQFEPFGPGNPKPVFVSRNVRVQSGPSVVGRGHLKMKLSQDGSPPFDSIGFNMHEYLPMIREAKGEGFDIAYELEENFWNNRRSLQIHLKDIQSSGSDASG
ncbi:MAG: single-stranded-DNA-specific exonuclease RecJ, partial [Balneolaceae bacterium]